MKDYFDEGRLMREHGRSGFCWWEGSCVLAGARAQALPDGAGEGRTHLWVFAQHQLQFLLGRDVSKPGGEIIQQGLPNTEIGTSRCIRF